MAVDKIRSEVSSRKMKRRDFMKLSALMAGGALATVVLDGSLKSLYLIPKSTDQLVVGSQKMGWWPLHFRSPAF